MIEVKELTKSYGEVEALKGVSFFVKPGEVIGLLGPNGAGKTTLMKILTGFLHPTSGTVTIGGLDLLGYTEKIQDMIGYLPENAPLYPELTVQSYLSLIADLRGIPEQDKGKRLTDAVLAVGLESRLTRLIGTLSKGYRQRVGLAQAMLHKPSILILDEPTNGLDPTQIVEVRHLIRKLAKHSTVLVSTHILSEVEATCDRVLIIIDGELKADAMLSDLESSTDAVVGLSKNKATANAVSILEGLEDVNNIEVMNQNDSSVTYRVHGSTGRDLCPDIFQLAIQNNWSLFELRKDVKTLEAVFNDLAASKGGTQ